MANLITINLSKNAGASWGFRLQGGKDFATPLCIQKVNGASLAEQAGLQAGDAIVSIGGQDALSLRHKEAQDAIVRAGNNFQIVVQRGASVWKPQVTPLPEKTTLPDGIPVATKTSLAHDHKASRPIGSGHNTTAAPFREKLVNLQYNSPLPLYSEDSIAETLSAQAEVLDKGVLGINFKKYAKEEKIRTDSPTYRLLHGEDEPVRKHRPPLLDNEAGGHPQFQSGLTDFQKATPPPQHQPTDPGRQVPPGDQLPAGENVCSACQRLIVGVFVRIKNKNLHAECFKCATCGASLKNVGYYNINDKLYCDIHAKQAAKSNPPAPNMVPVTVEPGATPPTGSLFGGKMKIPSAFQHDNGPAPAPAPPAAAPPPPEVPTPLRHEVPEPAPESVPERTLTPLHQGSCEVPNEIKPIANGFEAEHLANSDEAAAPLATAPLQENDHSSFNEIVSNGLPDPQVDTQSVQGDGEHQVELPESKIPPKTVEPELQKLDSEPAHLEPEKEPALQEEPELAPPKELELELSQKEPEAGPQMSQPEGKIVEKDPVLDSANLTLASNGSLDTKGDLSGAPGTTLLSSSSHFHSESRSVQTQQFWSSSSSLVQKGLVGGDAALECSPAPAPAPQKPFVPAPVPAAPAPVAAPPMNPAPAAPSSGSVANPHSFGAPAGEINVRTHIPKKGDAPAPMTFAPAPAPAPMTFAPAPAPAPVLGSKPAQAPVIVGKVLPGGAPRGGLQAPGQKSAPRRGRGVMNQASASRIPMCAICQRQIRGPFVSALGKTWCPDHFTCATSNCRKNLIDMGFVEEQGELYCEHCYESYLAPICGKCDKRVKGDCLNAVGKHFHPECFCCTYCGKVFGSGTFYLEDGLPYCETDWNDLFTTKCVGCNFPIEAGDRWVEALNNNYHSQCFKCSKCQKNLEGQNFFAKGGKPFCKNHAQRGF